jgi:pyroglutamyl-peptidase
LNPSGRLAVALARRRRPALAGIEITGHVFATAYNAVDRDLPKLLARKPDVVLIFGLAGRRREVCVETRARNKRSILFPDVSGWRPNHAAIEAGQALALTGNAPFPRLLNALRQNALPARLSRDAGAYLCNYAYWRALRHARAGRWCNLFTSRRSGRRRGGQAHCAARRPFRGLSPPVKIC